MHWPAQAYTELNFNSLPNDEILDWSKFKAFADGIINLNKKSKLVLERVENIVEKRENAGDQHFLLFPQCFQKPSHSGSLKVGIVWKTVFKKVFVHFINAKRPSTSLFGLLF